MATEVVRPKLWVELCAGSFAVGLRLIGGKHARPPVAYTGSKLGYGSSVLSAFGLHSGQGADAVMICEPGPWAHAWAALSNDEARAGVVARLRTWVDEDPFELWTRLLAEPPNQGDLVWSVSRWLWLLARSYCSTPVAWDATKASYAPDESANGVKVWGATTIPQLIERVAALPSSWPNTAIFNGEADTMPEPEQCPPGTFVYIDPPYAGTSKLYDNEFAREDVIATAKRWAKAGAFVGISEGEPLEIEGWHHYEITHVRRSQKRQFSKQQREWLTLSRPPAVVVPEPTSWLDL